MARLKEVYNKTIKSALQKEFDYKNPFEVPRLLKVVINMGVGKAAQDSKKIQFAVNDLTAIAGQKPVVTKAKKSIAGFKVRENMNLGVKVTLRKSQMYEFVDRLINIALPHVRDFHGVSRDAFDKQGNYNLGLREQTVFPEITCEYASVLHGLEITFIIKNGSKEGSLKLLELFGMPFEKEAK